MSRSKRRRHDEAQEGVEPAICRKSSATMRPKGATKTGSDSDRKKILSNRKNVLQKEVLSLEAYMRKRDRDRKGKSGAVSAKDRSEAEPDRARPEGVALVFWNPKNTIKWPLKRSHKKRTKIGRSIASLLLDK